MVSTDDAGFVNATPNQWFTGSLEAPSPVLPKAGMLALGSHFVYQSSTGSYGDNAEYATEADHIHTLESLLVIKYGITDKLSIEALPSASHRWNNITAASGLRIDDLTLERKYRVKKINYHTGSPSVTFDLGVTLPAGTYDRLGNSLNGPGQGAYLLKQGVVAQSLFDTWGNHPVRIRVYGSMFEPVYRPSVTNISVYGTGSGFSGDVHPGVFGESGIGARLAFNQSWVLAFDSVQSYAAPFRLNGIDGTDGRIMTRGRPEVSPRLLRRSSSIGQQRPASSPASNSRLPVETHRPTSRRKSQ